jgi:hypothetical protein
LERFWRNKSLNDSVLKKAGEHEQVDGAIDCLNGGLNKLHGLARYRNTSYKKGGN